MTGLEAIGEAIGALKGVSDLAKSLIGLRDTSEIKGKVTDLLTQVITAQSNAVTAKLDQLSLLERIHVLEGELKEKEDWLSHKQHYETAEVASGVFAYVKKTSERDPGPNQYFCPTCFSREQIVILQKENRMPRIQVLFCNSCSTELYIVGISMRGPAQASSRKPIR